MPVYDVSLLDFLKYASTQTKQRDEEEEFFPLSERIEMTKRICDGLLFMNGKNSVAHRDIKLRSGFTIFFPFYPFIVTWAYSNARTVDCAMKITRYLKATRFTKMCNFDH